MGLTAAVIAVMMLVLLPGCSDDDDNGITPPTDTEFELVSSYMAANSLDLPEMLSSWIITAQDLFDGLGDYFIMDIRKSDKYGPGPTDPNGVPDFEDGHIPGAHSVALADVVTDEAEYNTTDLPVVVVCYTGHDAAHAVMALRLSGVADARSLKWGMSGWTSDFDFWTRFTGDAWLDYDGCWVDGDPGTAPPELPSNTERPELDTSLSSGSAILEYQIDHAVLDGLNGITNAEVLDAYDDYHIICYWGVSDWDVYGNITTAYQVTGGELGLETLDVLDPDGINVIYCWSGQTASMIAAWLNVLGYDGRTLKFSANGMIHDALDAEDTRGIKWTENTAADLDYDTGE
jgi:rhodanese-related sulfurtransferase